MAYRLAETVCGLRQSMATQPEKEKTMDPVTLGLLGLGAFLLFRSNSDSNGFSYRKIDGAWRAYFKGKPPSTSHVLHDNNGYYVCWDRPLRTEQEARQVARRLPRLDQAVHGGRNLLG